MRIFMAMMLLAGLSAAQNNMPSPPATADVTLKGQQISISYSRPSMRGRKIMGGLVPYGQVWRTGANEATTLTTPVDLNIGGTNVPAGKYTVWTLPTASEWKLIINKQTGQWGTEYDQSQDLARVKGDDSADLVLEWEKTRISVLVK